MKIVVLDRLPIGADTPLDALYEVGDVKVYDSTNESELLEKASNADVLVFNKVKITARLYMKLCTLTTSSTRHTVIGALTNQCQDA